jgi:RHS repeat-associated protein
VADWSNTAGSAAVKGNEVYGPYGKQRYQQGTHGTPKGFTGQYNDSLTGLDYYNTRYYDPVVGVFLSADTVQGNMQGENPYAYVNGNPETDTDPSGQYVAGPPDSGLTYYTGSPYYEQWGVAYSVQTGTLYNGNGYHNGWLSGQGPNAPRPRPTPHSSVVHRNVPVVHHSSDSLWGRLGHGIQQLGGWLSNVWHDLTGPTPPGEVNNPLGMPCGTLTLSFAPMTKVATSRGEKAIGSLHPGEHVWAYNPKTHKMELEPVVHVWINHDNDLVDVTIASTIPAQHGKAAQKTSEVVHTNQKHPFLTVEKGFIPVSQLRVGMHVMKAVGGVGTITMLKAIPGTMTMYNLEIAQDHTFTVGEGEWIVHNCGGGPVGSNGDPTASITMQDIMNNPYLVENMTPEQVANIARQEGWVVGPLKQSQHGSAGISMNQPNAKGTGFTDQYVQYHEGGGYHGDDPYWKISSGKGGTVRVGPQFPRPSTGGDSTGGDIPDLVEP